MKSVVVIPTYNEAENIERLITEIFKVQPSFHIIVVDDNSPDGTSEIVEKRSGEDERVRLIQRSGKRGLGTACIEGFKAALEAGADLIFEMDADFSHSPEYLEQFLVHIEKADLVIGSRYFNGVRVEGWRYRRLLFSKIANMFAARIMLRPVWDFTSGFRCYRRAVLESMDLDAVHSDGYAFQIEMIHNTYRNKFTIREIPIIFRDYRYSYSKINRDSARAAFWMVWRCRAPVLKILKHFSFFSVDSADLFERISHDETK